MGMGMVGLRDVLVVTQQQQNLHYHHQKILPQHMISPNNTTPPTLGVIPLLTTTPCVAPNEENMINLWQNQSQNQNQTHNQQSIVYTKKPMIDNSATRCGGEMYVAGVGGGTTCQDCGNQAKKDCNHRRCRTCCKSRGFDCSTHVKSTWVPAARRRERQLSTATGATGSSASTSTKKPRFISSQTTTSHTSTSNTTPPRSLDTGSSSHQDGSFKGSLPGQVCAPAVFKCVRVTAIEDGEDEFAYQAMVKIGGHVFKGFLYDHGADGKDGFPNISDLHLGANNGASSSSPPPVLDPPDVYGASGPGGLLGGTPYGNQIN